ncbi:zinc finger FYVE domain-containing protein 1 [Trichonephila inaurata madagascariensis]|uniref:Zinc finger FYVE domain-containing protein 1 n=1 Tax=Trichonephila inaurata madagascariensis TaxID=2747483 RepID=A0A8X6YK46_9ARAC|nr:zinc finger FYVE domain-containing protein 1 [Trichonephila inaurata madagascariensis]
MSAKPLTIANSRLLKFKATKVKSSRKVCDERLACRGNKPYAVYSCKQCDSNQCEACEALLHEDFRLKLHEREIISEPSYEELCEGNCEDRNFADLTCNQCERNYCFVCDHIIHCQTNKTHTRTKFINQSDEFLSCDEIPDEYLPLVEGFDISTNGENSAHLNLGDMMSLSSLPDLFQDHEVEAKYKYKNKHKDPQSFLLINDKEQLQVKDAEQFIEILGCGSKLMKVVSIFGNTGDGKSYTLNHTFFNGKEIFQTSAAQESCTVGVWAAYCPSLGIITIDTEGFLGQASNPNKRARMLLKVLAISDIVIYRTRAERLHNDMFSFLGDASAAYTKHFSQELEEACTRCNVEGPLSILGPAVIIFHETQHTDVLTKNDSVDPELYLRAKFQDNGYKVDAFSSLEYIGICSNAGTTNFAQLRLKIEKLVQNSTVRVPRSPIVIYKVLKVLNEKFSGNIDKAIPNTFPDQYFTCSTHCKSCKCRCTNSMNHEKDDVPHVSSNNCIYQHQYNNRIYLCKICYERGEKIIVSPKLMEDNDSSWLGFAKYAWSGYILECAKCGVIYRSRQYWYGNQDPWETSVRTEICHVWPDLDGSTPAPQNTAQYVIDNLSTVSEIVSSIGAKPTKAISSWVADQIAPSYWIKNSNISHCGYCTKQFEDLETKHHCRICGGGFCEACASESRVVPTWGPSPVRVCKKCFENDCEKGFVAENIANVQNLHNPPEVTVRKIGEAVHTTLGTVASAVSYPIGFIKDSARPSYWVPDHELINCHVCKAEFGPKVSKHHCRSCGEGVCQECSKSRKPVHSRGWNYPVRVCNTCVSNEE